MRLFIYISVFLLAPVFVYSQTKITTEEYIELYKDVAIEKMKEYKIPASITLAQGILESGSGNSRLATKANNHFGIKCHKDWKGKRFYMDDDAANECFRKYKEPSESYADHSKFLTERGRYSFLFELDIMDYKAWARGLKKAGYATNPKYPDLLIRLIERYKLYQYDIQGNKKYKAKDDISVNRSVALEYDLFETTESGRNIYLCNGKKFIYAKQSDTPESLAKEFEMYTWQILKYNELPKNSNLTKGEMVFLQKKKGKTKEFDLHIVQKGENIRQISQMYGIRLSKLYKHNNLPEGVQVATGFRLKLN